MGILGRINRAIKSNLNQVIDKMSDPAKEVELLITEMDEDLKKAKSEVISATADGKRAEMRVVELVKDAERWQGRAEQAVRSGDDALARAALERKMQVDKDLESARGAAAEQHGYVGDLKSSLRALEARLEDVKLRKESIKERAKAAKEGGSAHELRTPAFDKFDEMEGRVGAMEEMHEITQSLDGREAATEAKFRELERGAVNPALEDELAAIKRRLDKG